MKLITFSKKISFALIFALCFIHFSFGQNANNGGEVGYNQTIYQGEQPESFVNITPASGGNTSLDLEYIWFKTSAINLPMIGWEETTGINNQEVYAPPVLNQNTFFYRIARRNGFVEYVAGSNIITIIVEPSSLNTGGQIGEDQSIFAGETPDTLRSISLPTGGNPNLAIEYLWSMGTTPNFDPVNWTIAPGINNLPYYVPPPLGNTTYFFRQARREGQTYNVASNIVTIGTTVDIEDLEKQINKTHPNPVTNYLQIEFKEDASPNWQADIFDIKGSLQKSVRLEDVQNTATINLQDLAKGTYLIQLTGLENNTMESFKIVKE